MKQAYKEKALELALDDFDKFCKYAGVDSKQLIVCIERSRGLSYGQISQKTSVARSTVKDICDRCFSESKDKSEKEEGK